MSMAYLRCAHAHAHLLKVWASGGRVGAARGGGRRRSLFTVAAQFAMVDAALARRTVRSRALHPPVPRSHSRPQEDPELRGVSHVVVDEAHERTADGDFLLMVLRRLLARRDDLRVVLMSATLDAALFEAYFSGARRLTIPGRTFEVPLPCLKGTMPEGAVLRAGHVLSHMLADACPPCPSAPRC